MLFAFLGFLLFCVAVSTPRSRADGRAAVRRLEPFLIGVTLFFSGLIALAFYIG